MEKTVIEHFIALVLEQKLDKELVKKWYQTVKSYAPDGTLTGIQVVKPNFGRTTVGLVYSEDQHKHVYKIPLTRDLTDSEIEKIVNQWIQTEQDLDFDIETSVAQQEASHHMPDDAIVVSSDTYRNMSDTLAKYLHNKWVKERVDQGWSYGVKLSHSDKKHPMLRPWSELPEQYKKVDTDLPKVFMKILNDLGYVVLDKKALKELGWESPTQD